MRTTNPKFPRLASAEANLSLAFRSTTTSISRPPFRLTQSTALCSNPCEGEPVEAKPSSNGPMFPPTRTERCVDNVTFTAPSLTRDLVYARTTWVTV